MTFQFNRKSLVQNLSLLSTTEDGNISVRDIEDIRSLLRELTQAVKELQGLQVHSRTLDSIGRPEHGAMSELLRGQYLHLTQTGAAPNLVKVKHELGRVPQGAIFIHQTGICRALIGGSIALNVSQATTSEITFELNGAVDDVHICILI